jgi:hypothetical protein
MGITTIINQAKEDFGVDVPKKMAYRAKTKSREMILGDHKNQYHIIRDYFQTFIDKNLGSRCIVTTVRGPREEEAEAMQRCRQVLIRDHPIFHGLLFSILLQRKGSLKDVGPL